MTAAGSGPSAGICRDFVDAIGNTPLIRLGAASAATGCDILGKAEFMNPGGSVKDRAARGMILAAEAEGLLETGDTVVEGTAGNTGIGLAHICNARGYRLVVYLPDNQSREKAELLTTLGAEVRVVPTVPYADDMNYQKQARRFAESQSGALWINQFDNPANRRAHFDTTGPEIWRQTGGEIDAFTCAAGTGGSLAGISDYLKQQRPTIDIVLLDCAGSALYSYVTTGEAVLDEGKSITEGIGNARVTDNLAGAPIDRALRIADQAAVDMAYRVLREEGWFFGSSTALNICGAVEVARELGPGHTVVTLLCDDGGKYRSTLFNREWLRSKGIRTPA